MQDFDAGRLIYLVLMGLFVGSYFLFQARANLNKTLQQAAIWGLIFLGAIAAIGLWDDISQTVRPQQINIASEGKIILPRAQDGHYYLTAQVNGENVDFVVDTGATSMVLTQNDARAVGLDPDGLAYFGRAMTANGEVRTAPVRLDTMRLGSVTDTDVPAVVNGGEMSQSLLGMEYLQRWGRIEIANGEMILTR
jgi:aspartyl protease family protein